MSARAMVGLQSSRPPRSLSSRATSGSPERRSLRGPGLRALPAGLRVAACLATHRPMPSEAALPSTGGQCLYWLQTMMPVPIAEFVPSVAVTVTVRSVRCWTPAPSLQSSSKVTENEPSAAEVGLRP